MSKKNHAARIAAARAAMPRSLPSGAYDAQPVPVDPGLLRALQWRETMVERIMSAPRAVPMGHMVGSRYQGGASFAARSR